MKPKRVHWRGRPATVTGEDTVLEGTPWAFDICHLELDEHVQCGEIAQPWKHIVVKKEDVFRAP